MLIFSLAYPDHTVLGQGRRNHHYRVKAVSLVLMSILALGLQDLTVMKIWKSLNFVHVKFLETSVQLVLLVQKTPSRLKILLALKTGSVRIQD